MNTVRDRHWRWLLGVCVVATYAAVSPAGKHESAFSGRAANEGCSLAGVNPTVISVNAPDTSEWHGVFELPDEARLWEPAEPDETIAAFRQSVRQRLGVDADPRALSERQRALFAAMSSELSGEATNSALLLDGRAGSINPIGCLEAMLWKWQAARYPMLEHPTEFGAFVMRGRGRVRVYLSSADLVGQRMRTPVTQQVQADARAGFRLIAHIHNHPFLFDRVVGDRMWTIEATKNDVAGALAPSMTDVQFFRSLRDNAGLEEGWVTNGMHTARFRAKEFDLLKGRGGAGP